MTTVRIGLCIRRPSLRVKVTTPVNLRAGDHPPFRLDPGEYEVRVARRAAAPEWGARVCTFIDRARSEAVAGVLSRAGIPAEVVTMGETVAWSVTGSFDTRVHAVVTGRRDSERAALASAREQLESLPVDDTRAVPGLRRYPDELARVEPVRVNRPRGGDLHLVPREVAEMRTLPSPITLAPAGDEPAFEIADVRIGIDFHWDHAETLAFRGALELFADGETVTAVNVLALDDYLASLLGSEMRADWPADALAAQAVAARSTVLATRARHHRGEAFELCHDDHCQCYQGVARENETAREVLNRVAGRILVHGGRVADTRYAKISGAITEAYETAWEDEPAPYLTPVPCGPAQGHREEDARAALSRSGEENLREWLWDPPAWSAANPHTHQYPDSARDMERLFRWTFRLSYDELSELVKHRTGRDLGAVRKLEALERGLSGRISHLRVHGERGTVTVGRELAIRRLLSESHLPSSAFLVEHEKRFVRLEGLGWGHGVGLCQLGASGLAGEGWGHERILAHFYPGTDAAVVQMARSAEANGKG